VSNEFFWIIHEPEEAMRTHLPIIAVLLALAGCAARPPAPPEVTSYRCDEGRNFALSVAASRKSAQIEFSGMQFALRPAPSASVPGEHFSCDVLTVWREGDRARVDMDGETPFRNCLRAQ
jgi:membrane-bound inhibitor of C-type lysozyme